MQNTMNTLLVLLHGVPIGELRRSVTQDTEFAFYDSYVERYPRPTLGQAFLDDLRRPYPGRLGAAPTFFSNLLPDRDGRLRSYLAAALGVRPNNEFLMLAGLGEDLPGAVVVRPMGGLDPSTESESPAVPAFHPDGLARFSLAGVQLKFSMIKNDHGGFTYPPAGTVGDYIVKLPFESEPAVTENEFSVMRWARACGIDVPEVELVEMTALEGLPPELLRIPGRAFAVRRFDRPTRDARTHIEDMAQVFELEPDMKYEQRHYVSIAKALVLLKDYEGCQEFVRRLVFAIVAGNCDAHLKNWSLVYPDKVTARLAPAYDLVSTVPYSRYTREMALEIVRTRQFRDVSIALFRRFAEKVGISPDMVAALVEDTASAARDQWASLRASLPMLEEHKAAIEKHWNDVPLLRSDPGPT